MGGGSGTLFDALTVSLGCSFWRSVPGQLRWIPIIKRVTIVKNNEPVTITRCFSFMMIEHEDD